MAYPPHHRKQSIQEALRERQMPRKVTIPDIDIDWIEVENHLKKLADSWGTMFVGFDLSNNEPEMTKEEEFLYWAEKLLGKYTAPYFVNYHIVTCPHKVGWDWDKNEPKGEIVDVYLHKIYVDDKKILTGRCALCSCGKLYVQRGEDWD